MTSQGFKKHERINSLNTIDTLFGKGESLFEYPFKVLFCFNLDTPAKPGAEIAISVPKKRIKSAPLRNRVKRLLREAYRTNKAELNETLKIKSVKLSVFFIFVGTADVKYEVVREKIIIILERLQRIVADNK